MIEPLESRIAPAVLLNPKTVQYTDSDGDTVLLKTTAGAWNMASDLVFASVGGGTGEILLKINLADKPQFLGAKITLTASQTAGAGNGLANIGFIDATNINLGGVSVDGDLGRIRAGNPFGKGPGLGSLQADSMGAFGLDTQAGSGDLSSGINGAVNSVKVLHDMLGARLAMTSVKKVEVGGSLMGTATAFSGEISARTIGSVVIKGDLAGGSGGFSGQISAGTIGSVFIGGNVYGGSGGDSGSIVASDRIGKVTIGKSLNGLTGSGSGSIRCGDTSHPRGSIGSVSIGMAIYGGDSATAGSIIATGDIGSVQVGTKATTPNMGSLFGGLGVQSGDIACGGSLGSVTIHGNVYGSSGASSGLILAAYDIKQATIHGSVQGGSSNNTGGISSAAGRVLKVVIDGSLQGGTIAGDQFAFSTGFIAGEIIGSVSIGADLIGGTDNSTGSLSKAGAIVANRSIGSITIRGDITASPANPVLISAGGAPQQTVTSDLAIGSLKVGGSVTGANILAGFNASFDAVDVDAQIGTIAIGKDVSATNLVAGLVKGGDAYWGDNNDQRIADTTDLPFASRIASITIGGAVKDDTASAGDHFGFVAGEITSLKIGGVKVLLSAGPQNDLAPQQLGTSDTFVREL